MSATKITKSFYRCICELPDCSGNGRPWDSRENKIPARCTHCKRSGWNGDDKRTKDGVSLNIIDPEKKRRRKRKAA